MGIEVGRRSGIVWDVNVVPLIDILLVLLVIFMILPHRQVGLAASLPEERQPARIEHPESIIVQIGPEGAVRLNGSEVERAKLESRLEQELGSERSAWHFFRVIVPSSFRWLPKFWTSCKEQAHPR